MKKISKFLKKKKMPMSKKIVLSAGIVLANVAGYTQGDTHYSQFAAMPLTINPATAGMFEGSLRATADYRTQWTSVTTPWKTMAFSSDFKFGEDDQSGNFFNGGVMVHNDKAGDSNYKTGLYNLAFGYTVHTQYEGYFTMAIQGGMIQNSIDYSALNWESQYNGYEFDPSKPTMENKTGAFSFNRGDLSLGIYYFNATNEKFTFFGGLAANHVLGHNISMTQVVKDHIMRKYTAHGGCQMVWDRFGLLPNFLYVYQGPNSIVNIGADYKIWLTDQSQYTGFIDEISVGWGTYYRVGDAILASARFNYAGFSLIGNYDFNISKWKTATLGRGGLEILLSYRAAFGIGKGRSTKFL